MAKQLLERISSNGILFIGYFYDKLVRKISFLLIVELNVQVHYLIISNEYESSIL